MSACLTDDDLEHLTDTPMPALQMKWLDANKWVYAVSRRGRPKVAVAYFEQRMGVQVAANDGGAQTAPNWSASASK